MIKKRKPYLTNNELLYNIHQSKLSYCYFMDPTKTDYDLIVDDLDHISEDKLSYALQTYAKKQNKLNGTNYIETDFSLNDLTVRVMTIEHIPDEYFWSTDQYHIRIQSNKGYIKLSFAPFKQFIFKNKEHILVGLSHSNNNFEFEDNHGSITAKLGANFIVLTEQISHKPNFSQYSYLDEMKAQAVLRLCETGLFFNESNQKYPNPFAYYTRTVLNCFNGVLNAEKTVRNIRDELIYEQLINVINNKVMARRLGLFDK